MEIMNIPKRKIDNLERLRAESDVLNTEVDLYVFYNNKIKYILKELYPFEYIKNDNKLRTLLSIDSNSDIIPEYFIKPKFLILSDNEIRYWASDFVSGTNLSRIMNSEHVPYQIRKDYLIRIGQILKEMNDVRKNTSLKDFFIGNLHESNFIVDRNGNLLISSVDSMKINGNKSSNAKYLTPFALFNKMNLADKYRKDLSDYRLGDYVVDKNTDLYCYMMMLFNFITNRSDNIEISDFYNYLNCFSDIGIDKNLIEAFNRVISNEDNINPYEYVDTLTSEQVSQVRVKKL